MSAFEPKRKRERAADATSWVLGTIIVLLATLDLMVWATMRHTPNPISKFVSAQASWTGTPATKQASLSLPAR